MVETENLVLMLFLVLLVLCVFDNLFLYIWWINFVVSTSSYLNTLRELFLEKFYDINGHVAERHNFKDQEGLERAVLEKYNEKPKSEIKESCFLDGFLDHDNENIMMVFLESLVYNKSEVEEKMKQGKNFELYGQSNHVIGKYVILHNGECEFGDSYKLKTVFRFVKNKLIFITSYPT